MSKHIPLHENSRLPSLLHVVSSHVTYFVLFLLPLQFNVQVENVTARNKSLMVCLFRPDTSYTVRLRHSYEGPQSPWSLWSNAQHGRTGEDGESIHLYNVFVKSPTLVHSSKEIQYTYGGVV